MNIDISKIEKILRKLKRKDSNLFNAIKKKINQIAQSDLETIKHFKNLKHDLKDFKRVHIGSFVLIFRIKDDTIIFEKFDHHDEVYRR